MDLNDLSVNVTAIEQGDWVDNIPDMGKLRLKVRGIGNSDYKRLQTRLIAAIPQADKMRGQVDPVVSEGIQTECLIETVLLDWNGLTAGGQPVPYSKEKAKELLTNPSYAPLRNAVAWAASIIAVDRAARTEDVAKN